MSMLFKRIRDWVTSITAFRTGDVIPVDGPNGTAKMPYSNLAKEVIKDSANNTAATEADLVLGSKIPIMTANGPKSLPGNTIAKASEQAALTTYAQNVAHSIAPEFDPTRDYVVDEICTYEGTAYIFTSNHPAGTWVPGDAVRTSVDELFARNDVLSALQTDVGNMEKTLDNLYKLSLDDYYNIDRTIVVATSFQVQENKQYLFYLKSESLVSKQEPFSCLYVGNNPIGGCTSEELYRGIYLKYNSVSSGSLYVRTYEAGVVVRLKVFEIENATSIASTIDDKYDKKFNTYSESITLSTTIVQETGIVLKQGFKYKLYAKSDSLITDVTQVNVFYLYNTQTGDVSLCYVNSYKVLDGFEFEYTAPVSGSLKVRTHQVGITLDIVVKEEIPVAVAEDINKVDSNIKDIERNLYHDRDFDFIMYIPRTNAIDTTFNLYKDIQYTLYAKSDILLANVSDIFYIKTESDLKVIASCSPQQLLDGFSVNIKNEEDGVLYVRTRQEGVYLTFKATVKEPTTLGNNQFIGKSWAAYGDSIAAISNGNGLMAPGWAKYVNDKVPFEDFFGRSIGGTRFAWRTGGGSVSFVKADGSYDGRNDNYNKDNYPGTIPSGCTAIRGCLCSWDRITHMFPESIKNDIDIVCIMGGTNDDFSETDASFIDDNVTDTEWSQSGADYYGKFNGDFNIDTIKGGLASTIMKFQVWMPNAIIVVCTPLSGHNVGGAGYVSTDLYEITFDKRTAIEEIAKRASCPCIDVYSTCGISPFNRTEYITDVVHPYTEAGKKMLARALIMGLKNIEPMINSIE